MATGRRDYTWGFLNEAATEGRSNVSFCETGLNSIVALSWLVLISYTVPAGYKLALNTVMVCTISRHYNQFDIKRDEKLVTFGCFSDSYIYRLSDQNPIYFSEGEKLVISCYNADERSYGFYATAIGVLQQL